nr:8702_t:CDS:2 [Entrophospora candida]
MSTVVSKSALSLSPDEYRKRKKLILEKGHTIHGIIRRSSSFNTGRLEHLYKDQHERPKMALHLWKADRFHIVSQVLPTEIYNPGVQSHAKISFDIAEHTGDIDGLRTLRLLDAIRIVGLTNHVRFYQVTTIFTLLSSLIPIINKSMHPRGIAKLYVYWIVVNYREAYNMFACNGVLFNHESPRRGRTFVTRKISRAVAETHLNKQSCIYLDNIDSKRDWGHTRDYIGNVVDKSEDENMVGSEVDAGIVRVRVDPKYFRPTEVDLLLGNPTKAYNKLGWKHKVGFDHL